LNNNVQTIGDGRVVVVPSASYSGKPGRWALNRLPTNPHLSAFVWCKSYRRVLPRDVLLIVLHPKNHVQVNVALFRVGRMKLTGLGTLGQGNGNWPSYESSPVPDTLHFPDFSPFWNQLLLIASQDDMNHPNLMA